MHRTDPGAGTVMPEAFQLFVNPTNDTAVVPDVAGMTRRGPADAGGRRLPGRRAGDRGERRGRAGRVIRTDPAEGEGSASRIRSPCSSQAPVRRRPPRRGRRAVRDRREAGARQAITDAGLEVDVVYIDRPAGDQYDDEVMDQNPRVPARLAGGRGRHHQRRAGRRAAIADEPAAPARSRRNPQPTNPQPTNPPQTNPPPTTRRRRPRRRRPPSRRRRRRP